MSDHGLSFKQWLFAFAALATVTYLTWGDALNGYFIADDAWHVPLVYRALNGEPWLLWKQFISPYSFHDSLYLMYRPLTDITFATDCLFWKGNAWGYHLTNLTWHAISACLVFIFSRLLMRYVVLRDIPPTQVSPMVLWKIPLLVALLFVVYPGHAEPVCWPLPRIDSIAAAFTFLSLSCVLEFFEKHERSWLVAAILAMIPGLMTKEMCAAIPLVAVVLYVISKPGYLDAEEKPTRRFSKRVVEGLTLLWPMFALLAIYIVHRAISLGSVIGGYVGTIGASLNSSFLHRLFSIEAYWRLFHPINENVLGEDCVQDLLIRGIYLLLAVLIAINQRTPCSSTRLKGAGKLLFLLLIMILPCLQIWGVTGGLIGARHAYTLCVPFLLAVVVLIYPITSEKTRMVSNLRRTATALTWATFVLFFVMAKQYARAWSEATNEINTMRTQIEEDASFLKGHAKLVVMGLPTGIKGFCAFYTIDFLPGLLMPPLSKTDIRSKVICIDGTPTNDFVINRSLLKSMLREDKHDFRIWVESDKRFVTVALPVVDFPPAPKELKIQKLGTFVRHRDVIDGTTYFANKTNGNDLDSYMLSMDGSAEPMDFEILELKLRCQKGDSKSIQDTLASIFPDGESVVEPYSVKRSTPPRRGRHGWLSWSGQTNNKGESALPIYFPVYEGEASQTYRINLTQYKSWLFSGSSGAFRLDLPKSGNCQLESATLKQADDYIPELSFKGEGEIDTTGLMATNKDNMRFKYDVSKIPAAKGTIVEVSIPYYEFHMEPHTYRETTRSKYVSFSKELSETSGQFVVPPQVVSKPAYYQIRVCAINSNGDLVGSFSDPVTVSTVVLP